MPYALFCHEAKLSKAYPTEADVWKHARESRLAVDEVSEEVKPAPRRGWTTTAKSGLASRPAGKSRKNQAEAERRLEFHLNS